MPLSLSGCNNPPPPVPPFLLIQNQFPKDIAMLLTIHRVESFMMGYADIGSQQCSKGLIRGTMSSAWFLLMPSRAETYHIFLKTITCFPFQPISVLLQFLHCLCTV